MAGSIRAVGQSQREGSIHRQPSGGTRIASASPALTGDTVDRSKRSAPLTQVTQNLDGEVEIFLRPGPSERHVLTREVLEGGAVGGNGLFQALCPALPVAQDPKGVAEVVLRPGPSERHALSGTFLEGGAVGVGGLFQVLGVALPARPGSEGHYRVTVASERAVQARSRRAF